MNLFTTKKRLLVRIDKLEAMTRHLTEGKRDLVALLATRGEKIKELEAKVKEPLVRVILVNEKVENEN